MKDFLRQIKQTYGEGSQPKTDLNGRPIVPPRLILRSMTGMDALPEREASQVREIHDQTGVSLDVIFAFFVKNGRYNGERRRSFINSVRHAQGKHPEDPDFAEYVLLEHIDDNGKVKVGDVLNYKRKRT